MPAYSLPRQIFLGNYVRALQSNLPRYFLNSTIIVIIVLLALVALSAPAAFAVSKMKFKQSEKLMSFFLFGMMIPIFACLIPMFRIYNAMGIRNTYWAVVIPQAVLGCLCAFIYIKTLCREFLIR